VTPRTAYLILFVLALALLLPGAAFAANGPTMPWDQALDNLVKNLTGTVARLMVMAAVVVAGLTWAFTEHGTGGRKLSQLVFGGAIALGAAQMLTNLGLSGALV
jgi:type IV secretory pathway VirB2 component (pilin)